MLVRLCKTARCEQKNRGSLHYAGSIKHLLRVSKCLLTFVYDNTYTLSGGKKKQRRPDCDSKLRHCVGLKTAWLLPVSEKISNLISDRKKESRRPWKQSCVISTWSRVDGRRQFAFLLCWAKCESLEWLKAPEIG